MGGTELIAHRMVNTIDPELMDGVQITHSRIRSLSPEYRQILVLHDLAQDPEVSQLSDPKFRKQFDKLVFVSEWQFQQYNLIHGVRYDEAVIIKNAIEPFQPVKKNKDIIKLIYHTTPHRGLELLIPVFEALSNEFDNIELDVYSSFEIYGWAERDKIYQDLFDKCRNHPNINYHGFQPNDVIRKALTDSHIFAYPCIWQETSSLATIEALCSGNIVVHPNLAALPETSTNFGVSYQYSEDASTHAHRFYDILREVIQRYHEGDWVLNQVAFCNAIYDWSVAKRKWERLLREVKGL
jgi:glycosyltransferase involved in cell wall biosynthesis